jgi:cyclophilin family peptidyl-prolyl cis-trans isomerase
MMNKALLALFFLLTTALTSAAESQDPVSVLITTSKGDITVELLPAKAPETVANFLRYVDEGFYNGTIFHRVISGFMIQGGGYDQDYTKKQTHDPVTNEADNGLSNVRGSIAMARTGEPHSATAQFFINHTDNPALDHRNKGTGWGYAVFGKVVDGMAVVDRIANVKTGPGGPFRQDAPREMIIIEKISLINE